MTADLSAFGSWFWIIVGLIVAFVILRYFLHVVIHIFHFVMSFFWHGCATVVVLLAIYYVLRILHIL
jgi:hypothetical protein